MDHRKKGDGSTAVERESSLGGGGRKPRRDGGNKPALRTVHRPGQKPRGRAQDSTPSENILGKGFHQGVLVPSRTGKEGKVEVQKKKIKSTTVTPGWETTRAVKIVSIKAP